MHKRDVLVVLGCLAVPAGVGALSESPYPVAGYDIAYFGGCALIVAGIVLMLAVIVSAALERPIETKSEGAPRPDTGPRQAAVDELDHEG